MVEDAELILLQRLEQPLLHLHSFPGTGGHAGGIELVAVAPLALGFVHGAVCCADQALGRIGMVRVEGDPDTGGDGDLLMDQFYRLTQHIQQGTGQHLQLFGLIQIGD